MCGVCVTFTESDGAIFAGYETPQDSCPRCHRLFPLNVEREIVRTLSARFRCNRQDDHETHDEHWFDNGQAKITWQYSIEEISQWVAGAAGNTSDAKE